MPTVRWLNTITGLRHGFPARHRRINAAHILLLIRESKVQSLSDLDALLIPPNISRNVQYMYRRTIRQTVDQLATASLVQSEDGQVSPTDHIEQVQAALDINLTDLAQIGLNLMLLAPIFGPPKQADNRHDVFVLMPFAQQLAPIYENHIKEVASALDLSVSRADDFFAANSIVSDIWAAIYGSRVVIADCTGLNPNVFYEIGISHTVGRPTILISQSIDDVPFDLRHIRCIVYEYTPRGMTTFNEALTNALRAEFDKLDEES